MSSRVAETICACSSSTAAWDHIRQHRSEFLWTDDEGLVATWNRLAVNHSADATVQETSEGNGLAYRHRGRLVRVPLRFNPDDQLLAIHTLAQLVKPDFDIRFCMDSGHSSDKAFLPLAADGWKSLESQVGPERVAQRFLGIHTSFDQFLTEAFPVPETVLGALTADLTDWEGGPTYIPTKLQYAVVTDGSGRTKGPLLRELVDRYIDSTTVVMGIYGSTDRATFDRRDLVRKVSTQIGRKQIRLMNTRRTAFVVIEPNGTAAGWRTDGATARERAKRKWWKVWQ